MPVWLSSTTLKWASVGLLALGNVLFYQLWQHEVTAFEDYQVAVKAAGDAQEEKVKQITKTQDLVNKGSVDVYKANSAAISNYYRGMRDNSGSCNLPTIPNAPVGADGKTDYTVFVRQCAQTTLQLNALQQWVTNQSRALE